MNTPGSVYQFMWHAGASTRISWISSMICSSAGAHRSIFVLLMPRNSQRKWLVNLGVTTLFIEPGSPWENGYVESFIGKLRNELLSGEIFDTLLEAKVIIENWRREYNQLRPLSYLVCRSPAPEAFKPMIITLGVAL